MNRQIVSRRVATIASAAGVVALGDPSLEVNQMASAKTTTAQR